MNLVNKEMVFGDRLFVFVFLYYGARLSLSCLLSILLSQGTGSMVDVWQVLSPAGLLPPGRS